MRCERSYRRGAVLLSAWPGLRCKRSSDDFTAASLVYSRWHSCPPSAGAVLSAECPPGIRFYCVKLRCVHPTTDAKRCFGLPHGPDRSVWDGLACRRSEACRHPACGACSHLDWICATDEEQCSCLPYGPDRSVWDGLACRRSIACRHPGYGVSGHLTKSCFWEAAWQHSAPTSPAF